jgi:hypothetical protein
MNPPRDCLTLRGQSTPDINPSPDLKADKVVRAMLTYYGCVTITFAVGTRTGLLRSSIRVRFGKERITAVRLGFEACFWWGRAYWLRPGFEALCARQIVFSCSNRVDYLVPNNTNGFLGLLTLLFNLRLLVIVRSCMQNTLIGIVASPHLQVFSSLPPRL